MRQSVNFSLPDNGIEQVDLCFQFSVLLQNFNFGHFVVHECESFNSFCQGVVGMKLCGPDLLTFSKLASLF